MKRLMRLALRLYPDAWRRRYGPEVGQLIDDGSARPTDLLDLVSHAPVVATFRGAASAMNERLAAHPVRLALIALAITFPTALLVAVAVLKYVLGVPAPFDAIESTAMPFITHPIGETILVLAPYVAFSLAILPFTRLRLGWREGRLAASAEAAVPVTSLAVGAISAALIVFMGLYWVAENL
jgi:hypothetical protein